MRAFLYANDEIVWDSVKNGKGEIHNSQSRIG